MLNKYQINKWILCTCLDFFVRFALEIHCLHDSNTKNIMVELDYHNMSMYTFPCFSRSSHWGKQHLPVMSFGCINFPLCVFIYPLTCIPRSNPCMCKQVTSHITAEWVFDPFRMQGTPALVVECVRVCVRVYEKREWARPTTWFMLPACSYHHSGYACWAQNSTEALLWLREWKPPCLD